MLFHPGVDKLPETITVSGMHSGPTVKFISKKKLEEIGKVLPEMQLWVMCKAEWSTTDLLEYLLDQVPKAKVKITTWTMTVPAVKALAEIRDRYKIEDIKIICDRRVIKACFEAYDLATKLQFQLSLNRIHAKILTIESETLNITVLSSANMSRNPRWEAACICENKVLTSEFSKQIDSLWI
jgi:hypothetical protein